MAAAAGHRSRTPALLPAGRSMPFSLCANCAFRADACRLGKPRLSIGALGMGVVDLCRFRRRPCQGRHEARRPAALAIGPRRQAAVDARTPHLVNLDAKDVAPEALGATSWLHHRPIWAGWDIRSSPARPTMLADSRPPIAAPVMWSSCAVAAPSGHTLPWLPVGHRSLQRGVYLCRQGGPRPQAPRPARLRC